jgi:hypothetical protein
MLARIVLTALSFGVVHYYPNSLNATQRYGLSLLGGSSFLTAPVVYASYYGHQSPFDYWAPAAMTFGMITFLWGSYVRLRKHQRANDLQVAYWEQHKRERGGK